MSLLCCHHPPQIGALGMDSLARRVADIFDEESENDQTFHGFSDSEISDLLDIKVRPCFIVNIGLA